MELVDWNPEKSSESIRPMETTKTVFNLLSDAQKLLLARIKIE